MSRVLNKEKSGDAVFNQNGRSMRGICEDFCLRLGEKAANFVYKYIKSHRKIYKKIGYFRAIFDIHKRIKFANDKGIWQIYIYDINVEKNGVTDAFDIKISHTAA